MRIAIAVLVIISCVLLMASAVRFGLSKILGSYALLTNSVLVANESIGLTPSDPQAHRARAIVLNNLRLPLEAAKEMEIAVSLRPQDDYLWLELGNLREAAGDSDAALAAFNRAVEFAPYYGHTRWQRGNLLVRMRKYDEGFEDLRVAASSNRDFLPALIDLAWGISQGDAKIAEQLVKVTDDKTRVAFARYLARHGKASETLDQLRQVKSAIAGEVRKDLILSLIQNKAYTEAHEIWKDANAERSTVKNGSFEDDLLLEQNGFGWQAAKIDGVGFALDVNQPQTGSRSLRISFAGYENQDQPVLSQLLVVKPATKYRLMFAVKTRDLVTGGLPVIAVNDAASGQIIVKSEPFQPTVNNWVSISLGFTTLSNSTAVSLNVQRNKCSSSPCPIFGTVWIDSFAVDDAGLH
jgi:tetratricopeptide (TPR) repeat protein